MANTVIRITNTDSYARWAQVFKDRTLDSAPKLLLVRDVSRAEFEELSRDPNVRVFGGKQVPLPDDKVKVKVKGLT